MFILELFKPYPFNVIKLGNVLIDIYVQFSWCKIQGGDYYYIAPKVC